MSSKEFLDKNIAEIHDGFSKKTLDPIDVAQECINLVEKLEDKYHAWVVFDKDLLLQQANETRLHLEKGGQMRALEGIPVGIKDIFNTIDFPTQMGSPLWKDFTPGNDARVVYQVKEAGGIIPGKTVTAEFAVHALNDTRNPHDVNRTPGTSSSGSAVAVALGMLKVALGTQTAGSIVRPASFCGIYGCKPSFGLIPRTGMLKTTDSLDTIGYFTAFYSDLRRVFDVLRVHGPDYPFSYAALKDASRQMKPAERPWRVVLVKTHTWKHAYPYAQDALLNWVKKLADVSDIEVFEAELPSVMERSHEVHSTIYDRTLAYYFQEEFKKSELVSSMMNEIIRHGNTISVGEYKKALEEQEVLAHAMDRFFTEYDVIVSLSTAGEAPLREVTERPDPALMWTMTHLPVISAPVFVSPEGLPFGLQMVARRYNDPLLFKFADNLLSLGLIPKGPNPSVKLDY